MAKQGTITTGTGNSDTALAAKVAAGTPPNESLGSLAAVILAKAANKKIVVINLPLREVLAIDAAVGAAALAANKPAIDDVVFVQDEQKRVAPWTGTPFETPNNYDDNVIAAVGPQKPVRSLAAMLAMIEDTLPAGNSVEQIIINQETGQVILCPADGQKDYNVLKGAFIAAGDTLVVEQDIPAAGGSTPDKFE